MVASRALVALALALAAGAAAQQHVCDPGAPGGCTVCDECCHIAHNQTVKCEACFSASCAFDCDDDAEACSRQCVQHCWSEVTSAPCIRDCVSCHGLWLLLGVLVPYLGRLVVDFLLGEVKKRCGERFACCRPKGRGEERQRAPDDSRRGQPLLGTEEQVQGFTMDNLTGANSSWAAAVEANGLSPFGATVRGAGRFLLWHVAQPAGYFAVYGCAVSAGELDDTQLGLGFAVAWREALYLLTVLACVVVNPAFLLVDVGASVRDTGGGDPLYRGYSFLAIYVLAPEMFVAFALSGQRGLSAVVVSIMLDGCGMAALGAGLRAGGLPPALAVGYCVTTLAALAFIGILAAEAAEGCNFLFLAYGAVLAVPVFGPPLAVALIWG